MDRVQAAKWSGVQATSFSQAGASRVESTRLTGLAGQQVTIDVIAFTQWLEAMNAEGRLTPSDATETPTPDPKALSGFLYGRFRPELRSAVGSPSDSSSTATRRPISSRIGRTSSTERPAGSSSSQSS
jgi:hypothetical protein